MVAFVVYVGLSIRPSGTAPEPASDRDIAPGLVSELEYGIRDRIRFGEFVYDGTRGRDVYRIRATEAVSFPAGGTDVFRLKDIVFESRLAATGRPITVTAPRAEFRRNSREMKAFDGVWIQSGELVLSAAIVVFEPEQNVLFSNGPVAAVLGELAGRAEAGSIDTRLGTVSLSGAVRVRGTARDGRYIDVAAPKVRIDRLGTLKAESGALVRSERFLLRATSVEERREGEGSRLAAQGHLTMLVPDEARGGPLKDSPIMAFGGSAELHRDPAGLPINGFLAALQPGGEELGDELMGFSRIDAAAPGGDGPRRLLSPRFDLLFQDGRLAEIQKEFESQGVVFLHIDSNVTEIGKEAPAADGEKKSYENIREHLAEKKLPFRVFVDHGNKVADLFGATSTPHVYVFDTKGKLVYRGLVDDDQRGNKLEGRTNYLRDTVDKLASGVEVTAFSTKEVGCSIKRVDGGGKGRRPRGEGRGRDGGK